VKRLFVDDLPSVSISRLRAIGVITTEMHKAVIGFGDLEVEVDLTHRYFANNGSWSFFRCPQCGRRVRTLRLLCGDVLCKRCCARRGVRYRCEPLSVKKRAELRIPKLKAMLGSEVSLRLKPVLWGKLERRSRLQAALERAEYVVRRSEFKRQVKEEGDVAVHSKVSAWLRSSRS
jgi:hypothetical protein